MTPALVSTREELQTARSAAPGPLALVPTMGALHDGHAALLRAARRRVGSGGSVVATVFVNPLQFGPGEDFDRYPRTLDHDLGVCAREGVDLVFAPPPAVVYPAPPRVRVAPDPGLDDLEGAVRPGHLAGVLTVVAKLVNLVRPDAAVFGEKDYQQLTLVRAMVRDLELPGEVLGVPTVREADGLALSSRNRFLSAPERGRALALPAALRAGAAAGPRGADAVLAAAHAVLDEAGLRPDYVALRSPDLAPAPAHGPARLLLAARVGTTRLIDNAPVDLGAAADRPA